MLRRATLPAALCTCSTPLGGVLEPMPSLRSRFSSPPTMRDDIVEKFQRFLARDEVRRGNFNKQPFYRPDDIKDWLSHTAADGITNEVKLLKAVQPERSFPVTTKEIANARLIFALLVSMDCGHMISTFLEHINSDSDLNKADLHHPFTMILKSLRRNSVEVPPTCQNGTHQSVIEAFDEQRWAFVPALIEKGMNITLYQNQVLPFFDRKVINNGGTATVYYCKVQTDLVCSVLKDILGPAKNDDATGRQYYEVAVKTYMSGYEDIYRQETNAFKGMQNQEGLGVVKYLGEYRAHSDNGQDTNNILLEFGEQDLDEYLADASPPILNEEIIGFWQSIFEVAETLQRMHQFNHTGENKITERFNGWHGDIKPDNILRIRGRFQLADFGFAQFEKQGTHKTQLKGGTRTFGAPERDIKARNDENVAQLQTVDTWSFGCVMSAVATWLILGQTFYACYGKIRQLAIQKLRQQHERDDRVSTPDADDGFHDGSEVLRAVLDWHNHLRNSARRADTISYRVLDLVDQKMLISDPEMRLSSSELCDMLRNIVHDAKEEYRLKLDSRELVSESEDTLEVLLKLDQHSPSVPTPMNEMSTRQNSHANNSSSSSHTISYSRFEPSNRIGKSERIGQMRIGKTANRERVLTPRPGTSHQSNLDDVHNEYPQFPANSDPSRNSLTQSVRTDQIPPRWASDGDRAGFSPPISGETLPPENMNGSRHKQPQTQHSVAYSPISATSPDAYHTNESGHGQSLVHRQSFIPAGNNAILDAYDELVIDLEASKGIWSLFVKNIQKDPYLQKWIYDRDIKFVVDNAESMKPHWDNVKKTLLVLAMKLGPLDEDGLDLVYASGQEISLKNVKASKIRVKFEESMGKAYQSMGGLRTDMQATLSRIFDEYQSNHKNPPKKQTVIILTDGLWLGSNQNDDVENLIRTFVNELDQRNTHFERRRFSIQFISFGDYESANDRLRRLDDHLGAKQDVVDAKPWHFPDVNGLILGSMIDIYDKSTESSPSPVSERQSNPLGRTSTFQSQRKPKIPFLSKR